MKRAVVVALLVVACGHKHKPEGPPPDCKALAPHLDDLHQPDPHWHDDAPLQHRLDRWTDLCEVNHFSDALRGCLAAATSLDDSDDCNAKYHSAP